MSLGTPAATAIESGNICYVVTAERHVTETTASFDEGAVRTAGLRG